MRTEADDKLDREVRVALEKLADGTTLRARFDSGMPWLWDEQRPEEGYWIGCGLEHLSCMPASQWRTFLWAQYRDEVSDYETHTRPLDVYLSGESARNANVLAAMAVTAVASDVRVRIKKAGSLAAVPDFDLADRVVVERVKSFAGHIEDMSSDERLLLLGYMAEALDRRLPAA